MPDLATLLDQGESTRTCRKCNTDKPLVDERGQCQFVVKKDRRYGVRYVTHECQACRRRREKLNRERRAQTPEGRAAESAYRRDLHQRQRADRERLLPRYREDLELMAPIPAPVLARFLYPMLADAALTVEDAPAEDVAALAAGRRPESGKMWGIGRIARRTGVAERSLNRVLEATYKSVELEIADKLAAAGDFTLNELTDAAREWALLAGDPWPLGYRGVATALADLISRDLEVDQSRPVESPR